MTYKAVRNEQIDYENRYYVNIETIDDVVDYVSFSTEEDAETFIEYYNSKK